MGLRGQGPSRILAQQYGRCRQIDRRTQHSTLLLGRSGSHEEPSSSRGRFLFLP